MSASEPFDLRTLPESFYEDPYPTYARLRAESPVYACPDGSYFLTRYDDINRVYRDPRRFSSDKRIQFAPVFGVDSPLYEHHTTSLVFNDPPLHTRVRKAIGNALSMQMVRAMQAGLETLVDELLDGFQEQQQVDLIADYAAARWQEGIDNHFPFRRDLGRHISRLLDQPERKTAIYALLNDYLTKKRVTFILDGLDEVTDAQQRNEIVIQIEDLIRDPSLSTPCCFLHRSDCLLSF